MHSLAFAFLTAPLLLNAQLGPPGAASDTALPSTAETATVHGIVLNAATGEPLPRALVHMTSGKVVGALTDGEGRFSIAGVPTGLQTFDIEKPGFGQVVPMSTYTVPASHTVRVEAEMPDLRFPLSPQNAIYGQITLSTGDPGVGIGITLLKQIMQAGHSAWNEINHRQTGPEGQFRFAGLDDGTYLLMTRPTFDNDAPDSSTCNTKSSAALTGFAQMFYGVSNDIAGAARIVVNGGQSTRANFTLTQAEFHEVQVSYSKPPASVPWQIVGGIANSDGMALEYPLRRDEKAHAFCAFLPDGAYIFTADASVGCGPEGPVPCAVRGVDRTRDLQGLLAFNVEGSSLRRLQVPLSDSALTPVHMHYEPGPPPRIPAPAINSMPEYEASDPLTLAAVPANEAAAQGDNVAEARSAGSDTYQLSTLKPGRYWIGATINRPGTCLGPVTAGGQNLAHTPWTAGTSGTGQEIDVVLRTDCAKLSLQLPPGFAGGLPGEDPTLFFYVVPAFDFSGDLHEGRLQASGDRQIDLTDMTPGTYRVYTFTSPHAIEFHNPDAMDHLAGQGQEITLEPGGNPTLVLEVPAS